MNGYTLIFKKIVDGAESEEYIPIFIDKDEKVYGDKIVGIGVKHLEKLIKDNIRGYE